MRLSLLIALAVAAASPGAAEMPVRGRVVDEAGRPVADARAELRVAPTSWIRGLQDCRPDGGRAGTVAAAHSADDGLFELAAPGAGVFQVRLAAPGYLDVTRDLGPTAEPSELENATLVRADDLRVVVLDPDGRGVAGVGVKLSSRWFRGATGKLDLAPWSLADRHASTRDDGSAVLPLGRGESARLSILAPPPYFADDAEISVLSEKIVRLAKGPVRTVEIRDANSAPVSEALLWRLSAEPLGGYAIRGVGLSDAEGRLRVTAPAEGALRWIAETASGLYGWTAFGAPADGESDPLVLTLTELPRLSGRLTDAGSGRPIPGAWVATHDDFVETAGDGRFALPRRETGGLVLLRAAADGYVATQVVRRLDAATEEGAYDLELDPAIALHGAVVDEAEEPIAGVEIGVVDLARLSAGDAFVIRSANRRLVRSDADGLFRLSVGAGRTYRLDARREGFLSARTEVEAGGGEPVILVLERGRKGVGRVLDLDEEPIAGAAVRLWPAVDDPGVPRTEPPFQGTSDETGRFEISQLGPGRFDLRVTAPGFAPLAVEGLNVVFDDGSGEVDLGTVILEPGVRVAGRVVDSANRGVEDVKVSYDLWSSEGDLKAWEYESTEVTTDADGAFTIIDLMAGEKLDLSAWHLGYAAREVQGVVAPDEDLLVELERTAAARGRVVGADGAPISQGRVWARFRGSDGGPLSQSSAIEDDGSFELSHLGARLVTLRATAEGFRSREVLLEVEPGEEVDGIVLELEPGAVVEGTVLGPSGAPVEDAPVTRYPYQLLRSERLGLFRRGPRTRTDAAGRFRLDGVDLGPLELYVAAPDLPIAHERIHVRPGVNMVEIRIEEGYEVSGRVLDHHGAPVAGARLSLDRGSAQSGESGEFVIGGVAAGLHTLTAWAEGFAERQVPGIRVDAPVWDLEVELHRSVAVYGRILGLAEGTAARLQIYASSLDERWAVGKADFGGSYRIAALGPGKWTVTAEEPASGRRARATVEIPPGSDDVELDLEFVSGLTFSGDLVVDGVPEAGATVRLRGVDVLEGESRRTDFNGTFEFAGLPSGRYRMVIHGVQRDLLDVRTIELVGDKHLRIDLSTAELRGRVVDANDGAPLDEVTVTLVARDEERSGETETAETDSRGLFRFPRLGRGAYVLKAQRVDYALRERPIEIEGGLGRDEIRVELERTSGLTLRLRDAAGGVPDVVFVAAMAGATPESEPALAGRFLASGDGEVHLTSLPPGTWRLVVRTPGSAAVGLTASVPGDAVPVEVPPETRLEVTVPALVGTDAVGTLEISRAGGRFLSVAAGGLRRDWRVRGGWTAVEGLPAGDWEVTVTTAAGDSWTGRVSTPGVGTLSLE